MEKFRMYYNNLKRLGFMVLLVVSSYVGYGQSNCLIFPENSGERLSCELSYRAIEYKQGGNHSQILFDAAIKLGPGYAWAYYEKSVPFFKRGLLREAVEILDHAIALEPDNYLCYRAYWYFSFRSYQKCIDDLERYYYELNGAARTTPGGDLEMRMLMGMAYTQIGESKKAVQVVREGIDGYEAEGFYIGSYAYHVLGMMYAENDELDNAAEAFTSQIEGNGGFADSYFYLAKVRLAQNRKAEAMDLLNTASTKFEGIDGGFSFGGFDVFNVSKVDADHLFASLTE